MIARLWLGRTRLEKADEFEQYLAETGIRDISATEGNEGVFTLRRDLGTETEFGVLSLWESEDAILRFSGESDLAKPHYYPRDHEFLLGFAPEATHYKLVHTVWRQR